MEHTRRRPGITLVEKINMTILKRIEDAKKLWNILMPHIPPPADGILAAWITRFPETAVEAGLVRGSKKFSIRKMEFAPVDAEHVHRYISGVIRNEAEAEKERTKMTQTPTNPITEETLEQFQARVDGGDELAAKAKVYVDAGAPNLTLNELIDFVNL
jgi:hypothetical protein